MTQVIEMITPLAKTKKHKATKVNNEKPTGRDATSNKYNLLNIQVQKEKLINTSTLQRLVKAGEYLVVSVKGYNLNFLHFSALSSFVKGYNLNFLHFSALSSFVKGYNLNFLHFSALSSFVKGYNLNFLHFSALSSFVKGYNLNFLHFSALSSFADCLDGSSAIGQQKTF